MTINPQIANVGLANNDHNGDTLRVAFQKFNQNFSDIYTATQPNSATQSITVGNSITIGNASVYATINSTSYSGAANNSSSLGGHLANTYARYSTNGTFSGNLVFSGANVMFGTINVGNGVFIANTSGIVVNAAVNATSINISGTANVGTLRVTGSSSIDGDLQVNGSVYVAGNTTYINSTVVTTKDKNLWLANNAISAVAASGAGILVGTYANLVFNNSNTAWQSNVNFIPYSNNQTLGTNTNLWNLIANNANANYIYANSKIQVGNQAGYNFSTGAVIEIDQSSNSYIQIIVQNANSGVQASGDVVVTADTGNDSVNYVDLGINSSTYSNATYAISGPLDAYLYSSNSNLVIGTATVKDVVVHAGGTLANNRVLTVNTTAVTVADGQTLVANVFNAISINTASYTIGANFIANSSGVYSTGTVNATSYTVGADLTANSSTFNLSNTGGTTTLTAYGLTISANGSSLIQIGNSVNNTAISSVLINTTGTVNAASHTIGTDFVANTTGVYTSGVINANGFVANTSGAYANSVQLQTIQSTVNLDLGDRPVYTKVGTISDARVTTNSTYTTAVSLFASGARSLANGTSNTVYFGDELEMDNFHCAAYVSANGVISYYITASPGPVSNTRIFNYILS